MNLGRLLEQFSEANYSDLVRNLKTAFTKIGFDNFDGNVITIKNIPLNTYFEVNHGLNRVPNYRIILRQKGKLVGSFISEDPAKPWTEQKAFFYNSAASDIAELTILFM
jgi:hypothetical protein